MIKQFFLKNSAYFIILLGTLISCSTAIYNQFPYVYPDTGTYIHSGFSNVVPNDRPFFYGFFLRHISLHTSLWLVILVQSFFSSFLIYKTIELFSGKKKTNLLFLVSVSFLSIFTGYSFNTSLLIPDIFTSISILCVINLVFNNKLNTVSFVFIYLLFLFSILTHFSNIVILFLLFLLLIFINKRRKKKGLFSIDKKRIWWCYSALVLSIFIIPFSNYVGGNGFVISNSSHVFIMNSLHETGIVTNYLKENCKEKNYKFCEYIDDETIDFMWDPNSPLYKTGGWQANKNEYNEIIKAIITNPNNWFSLVKSSFTNFINQLITFKSEIHNPEIKEGGPVIGQIDWRFPSSMSSYLNSKQNLGKNNLKFLNYFQLLVICISVLILSYFLVKSNQNKLTYIVIIILLHNLINAFICSNLSCVIDRFQNRLIWILPLLSILVISNHFLLNKAQDERNN